MSEVHVVRWRLFRGNRASVGGLADDFGALPLKKAGHEIGGCIGGPREDFRKSE